jgi:hypothetical protein
MHTQHGVGVFISHLGRPLHGVKHRQQLLHRPIGRWQRPNEPELESMAVHIAFLRKIHTTATDVRLHGSTARLERLNSLHPLVHQPHATPTTTQETAALAWRASQWTSTRADVSSDKWNRMERMLRSATSRRSAPPPMRFSPTRIAFDWFSVAFHTNNFLLGTLSGSARPPIRPLLLDRAHGVSISFLEET